MGEASRQRQSAIRNPAPFHATRRRPFAGNICFSKIGALQDARILCLVTVPGRAALGSAAVSGYRGRNFAENRRMSNPLSVLPLAMGAHGGAIDDRPATQLVSAGLTLLQRSAPLARAMYGKRAALLLPTQIQRFRNQKGGKTGSLSFGERLDVSGEKWRGGQVLIAFFD